MRIFVTGGSGFLGRNLITRLKREGHEVVALARSAETAHYLQALGARVIAGDLDTISEWAAVLNGVDALIHAAAPVTAWGEWSLYENHITQASLELYRAANHAQVAHFIFISTEAVLQGSKPLLDINESEPYPAEPNSLYGRAKKLAEIHLRQSTCQTALTILRPSFIWGPHSPYLQRLSALVQARRFVWLDGGRAAFERIHIDNVVEAIMLTLRRPHDGLYLLTDDQPATVHEFLSAVFQAMELRQPRLSLPSALLTPMAQGLEYAWPRLGLTQAPPFTRFELAFLSQPRRYDITQARDALAYKPIVSLEQGLAQLR